VVLCQFPTRSAVVTLIPLPVKGVRFHFTKRPTNRQPVGVSTAQDETIAFTPPLCGDDVVELRIYKNDAPLLKCRIEEPNRRSDRAFLLNLGRIAAPKVSDCATVLHTDAQQCHLFLHNG